MQRDSLLLNQVLQRRQQVINARNALRWALVNTCFAIIFAFDFFYGFLIHYFSSYFVILVIKTLGFGLCVLFTINSVYDVTFYCWPYFWMKPIELTTEQRLLFGISENELGFKNTPRKESKDNVNSLKIKKKSPPFVMSSENISPSFSGTNKSSMNTNNSFMTSTPNHTLHSSLNGSTSVSSWFYSPNISDRRSGSSNSQNLAFNSSFLRKRNTSTLNESIKDESSLEEYLKNFEETETKLHEMSKVEQQYLHNQSYVSLSDHSSIQLQAMSYQPASDVASVSTPVEELSPLSSNMKSVDDRTSYNLQFTARLNCTELQLYQWIENIRSWISQTILLRLVTEITKINDSLTKSGLSESLVGEIGLSSLKQLASLKHKEIPTLSSVLPYLELSLNQEYLVQRLKDLAKGGCIAEFNWNRGASHKSKPWSEELPSDAQIIMHVFCSYMDSRLPSHSTSPDGKPFTSIYFKTAAEHPFTKNHFYLLQSKLNPPHYNVNQDDGVVEIPAGRNNLFYAIICFLNVVSVKRFGLLGRVNLGPSGVNVLWTIGK